MTEEEWERAVSYFAELRSNGVLSMSDALKQFADCIGGNIP